MLFGRPYTCDELQVPIFITKVIELYEMICVRHGLMVVGPTGGGKSSNIAVLKEALTHLKVDIRMRCSNIALGKKGHR